MANALQYHWWYNYFRVAGSVHLLLTKYNASSYDFTIDGRLKVVFCQRSAPFILPIRFVTDSGRTAGRRFPVGAPLGRTPFPFRISAAVAGRSVFVPSPRDRSRAADAGPFPCRSRAAAADAANTSGRAAASTMCFRRRPTAARQLRTVSAPASRPERNYFPSPPRRERRPR